MKKDFKTTTKRLAQYFETSRDSWKARSLKYQAEKRELLIQKRDVERSKEKWKEECIQLKIELSEIKKKYQKIKEFAIIIMEQ